MTGRSPTRPSANCAGAASCRSPTCAISAFPTGSATSRTPTFRQLFADYARAFATRYPWVQLYTPVNEMYVCAKFSARHGWWNEQLASERAFVTALKHIVRANVLAMRAVLEVRPDAIFIQSESSEYFHAQSPDAIRPAEFMNCDALPVARPQLRPPRRIPTIYQYLLDSGMTVDEYRWFLDHHLKHHCVMGTDYYVSNEHLIDADGSTSPSGEIFGYHVITQQYWRRYGLPVMHTETNMREGPDGDEPLKWLRKEWANVMRIRDEGLPIVGFTWYSLTDQVDWNTALREPNGHVDRLGLYDLDRRIRPVGVAYRDLIREWSRVLPAHSRVLSLPIEPLGDAGAAAAEKRRLPAQEADAGQSP